jgi:transcriptional regulator with XRE-family HTH domain
MDGIEDLQPGSPVRRWRLGKRMRELREAAGKSQEEAAAYLNVKPPTISRLENGRNAILPKNVKFLCQLYEVGAPEVDTLMRQAAESNDRGWWLSYSDTMPDWFETYVGFEADASAIWTYQSELVPGLLQVPNYVRALRSVHAGDSDESEIAKSVEFRLARQKRFDLREPTLRAVLNEAALVRSFDSPETLRAQVDHLIHMSERGNVTIQILPFSSGFHRAMKGPFSMLTLPEEPAPNFVYLEHAEGAVYLERPSDLQRYTATFDALVDHALSPKATRDFLTSLVNGR